jgi:hypothetical protein
MNNEDRGFVPPYSQPARKQQLRPSPLFSVRAESSPRKILLFASGIMNSKDFPGIAFGPRSIDLVIRPIQTAVTLCSRTLTYAAARAMSEQPTRPTTKPRA